MAVVDAQVVEHHHARTPSSVCMYLLDEDSKRVAVNCTINDMLSDNSTLRVHRSYDSNCFKCKLAFFHHHWFNLFSEPNFWFYLIRTENCFVDKEDDLPPVSGLQNSRKAFQTPNCLLVLLFS